MENSTPNVWLNRRFPILFIATNIVLMGLYYSLPNNIIEGVVVRFYAVVPGGALLDWLTPQVTVSTDHIRIVSPIANLNVLKGCEGTETLLLLYTAVIAMLRPLKYTVVGLLVGTALVFALNQLRIISLFFIAAYQKDYFELVHGFVAPMLIIGIAGLFFWFWLNWANASGVDKQASSE